VEYSAPVFTAADPALWALTDAAAAGGGTGVRAARPAGLLRQLAIPDAVHVRAAGSLGSIAAGSFRLSTNRFESSTRRRWN
jgi:hypothetical protein